MKAILVNEDKSLKWDDVQNPVLGDNDCLVKIEAAALNRADLMKRAGTPEECANLVMFVASDEASYVSGQNYLVDGCRKKL